jgi:uncharacterized protein (DUF58 family)
MGKDQSHPHPQVQLRTNSREGSAQKGTAPLDPRLYCDNKTLLHLKGQAQGFSFLPHQRAGSVLAGRHQSRFRGRGLNFEELRHYHKGDDIRTLDWRVTLRTGKPHVRAYSEEKDHKIILCVDQSQSLFFASLDTMKSVAAAHIAALSAWRVIADNDRVGALIFNDHQHQWFEPQRSQHHVLRLLQTISQYNQQLSAQTPHLSETHSLAPTHAAQTTALLTAITRLNRTQPKDCVFVFISDFQHTDDACIEQLKRLQRHNDVLCVWVADPMEKQLPESGRFIASDGELQLEVDATDQRLFTGFSQSFTDKHTSLSDLLARKKLPLIEVDTSGNHLHQFRTALGNRAS